MAAGAGAWVRPFRSGFRVYFRLEPGGVLRGKAGFKTREAADAWAADARAKITTQRRTVDDGVADYRAELDARVSRNELRKETAAQTDRDLRRLMSDALDLPLSSLTPRRCQELYEAAANTPGVAASTHHRWRAFAHAWGAWAQKKGWFKANPWGDVQKIGKRDDHRQESLRVDEARQLREHAFQLANGGDEGAVCALVVLTCSLRPNEVAQMVVRDVDDDGRLLWVDGPRLKNQNTRRTITIADDELRGLLVAATARKAPTDRLFPRHSHRNRVTEAVQRVTEAAGVPVVDSRTLRRTFATLDARRGSSLDETAFSMGHGADSKARTARRHYIAPGAAESGAARRVLGVLDGGKRQK